MSVSKTKRLSKVKQTFLCIIFVVIFSGLLIVTLIINGLKYLNQSEDDLVKTPRKDVPDISLTLAVKGANLTSTGTSNDANKTLEASYTMNEAISVITTGLAGNSNFASNGRSAVISTVNTNERLTNMHLVNGTLASSYTMNATITINTTGLAGNSNNFATNGRSTMISTIDTNEILTNMQFETTISETKVPAVMTSIKPETTRAAAKPTTDLATTTISTTTEAATTTIRPETITPNNTMNTTLSQNSTESETNSTMNGTLVSASNVTSNFTAMNSTANGKNAGNATALSSTAAPKNYTTPGTTTAIPSTTAASTTASTTATTTSATTTTTQPATTTATTTSNPTTTKATTKATTTQTTTTSLATTTTTTTNPPTTTLEPWHQKYYGLGCYKSHEDDTNFPILVINLRPFIDWSNMTKTIEACAKEVIKPATRALHGVDFTFFAIRFFAECWANGETASTTYFSLGHADDCYMMTGAEWSYYVYRYGPATRPAMKPYNSLGCYRSTANAVPIRHLIGTYGSSSDPVTADSIARIKADCAKEALNRGYTTFGILNGGECWSGPNAHNSYDDDGAAASCANGLGSVAAYNVYQFTS